MAITYKLVEANTSNEIDLVCDGTDKLNWTGDPSLQNTTNATFHRSDNAPPDIIRLISDIRPMFFRMLAEGSTSDELLNNIHTLARWVDGPDQQAARFHIDNDVNRIELHVAIDGSTNTTIIPVIYGEVDTFDSLFSGVGRTNTKGVGAIIQLFLSPHGEGTPFTLRNDLASSPHMIESSSGLAHGWNLVGTPTASINSVQYLIGGSSQQFITDSSTNEGFRSDDVTAASSSTAVATVWLRAASGDPITVNLTDGSSVSIQTKTFDPASPAGFDFTAKGAAGNTWYRYTVSGTNVNANFRLFVSRTAGSATQNTTFRVDGAYLQTGTTTAPTGLSWISANAVENRYDPTSGAGESQINYLDTWGLPGDSNALFRLKNTVTTVTSFPNTLYISRIRDGSTLAASRLHWFDTPVAGGVLNGSFSTVVDANRAGGGYLRFTSTGTGSGLFTISIPLLVDFNNWPSRVFAVARSSNTGSTLNISGGDEIGFSAVSTWELLDLGLDLPLQQAYAEVDPTASSTEIMFLDAPGAGITVDIDGIIMLPVEGDGFFIGLSTSYTVNDELHLLGDLEQYFALASSWIGECWTLQSGQRMNRLIFNIKGTNNTHDIEDTLDTELTITPRTRHLLGTT